MKFKSLIRVCLFTCPAYFVCPRAFLNILYILCFVIEENASVCVTEGPKWWLCHHIEHIDWKLIPFHYYFHNSVRSYFIIEGSYQMDQNTIIWEHSSNYWQSGLFSLRMSLALLWRSVMETGVIIKK